MCGPKALGLDGKVIRIKADDLLAQALEHETDHLHGILYIDRLVSPDSLWKITSSSEDEDDDEQEEEGEREAHDTSMPQEEEEDSAG